MVDLPPPMAFRMPIWLVCWVMIAVKVLSTRTAESNIEITATTCMHQVHPIHKCPPPMFGRVLILGCHDLDALPGQSLFDV